MVTLKCFDCKRMKKMTDKKTALLKRLEIYRIKHEIKRYEEPLKSYLRKLKPNLSRLKLTLAYEEEWKSKTAPVETMHEALLKAESIADENTQNIIQTANDILDGIVEKGLSEKDKYAITRNQNPDVGLTDTSSDQSFGFLIKAITQFKIAVANNPQMINDIREYTSNTLCEYKPTIYNDVDKALTEIAEKGLSQKDMEAIKSGKKPETLPLSDKSYSWVNNEIIRFKKFAANYPEAFEEINDHKKEILHLLKIYPIFNEDKSHSLRDISPYKPKIYPGFRGLAVRKQIIDKDYRSLVEYYRAKDKFYQLRIPQYQKKVDDLKTQLEELGGPKISYYKLWREFGNLPLSDEERSRSSKYKITTKDKGR